MVVVNNSARAGASAEIVAAVAERLSAQYRIQVSRMGFAPMPCLTSSALEKAFYLSPVTIAARFHQMVRHNAPEWEPDAEKAALAYQRAFRRPF